MTGATRQRPLAQSREMREDVFSVAADAGNSDTAPVIAARPCDHEKRPVVALVAASLDILGGQGIQAQALADNLRCEGFRVLFVPVNPSFPRWLNRLRRYPYVRTIANQILYLPTLARLRKADVVHVFAASYFSFLLGPAPALLAAKIMRKRCVLNYHSGEANDHLGRWGVLVHPWLRLADEIVVPSNYLKMIFACHGYTARVIHNVVDVSQFRYRERARISPRLLSLRNLERHYGVETIIRAFELIRRKYPDATLVVGGYGSEERALKQLVYMLGLEGVHFIGRYTPAEAPAIYAEADVFLNASVVDNQPVSILEAFASGLPVVSTPTGDIGTMLQAGVAGMIVPLDDHVAMAAAVCSLFEDPDKARQIARRAYAALDRFSWSRVREGWTDVYGPAGS